MESTQSLDYLTLDERPVVKSSSDPLKTAFTILCAPVTYGVLLQRELFANDGSQTEYLRVRNRIIMRRLFLKHDCLNPCVTTRVTYLKSLESTITRLHVLQQPDLIAKSFSEFIENQANEETSKLTKALDANLTLEEYITSTQPRLLGHAENQNAILEYETALHQISDRISTSQNCIVSLLMDNEYTSFLMKLSNKDEQTRFFPVFTPRERAIIKSNLFSSPRQENFSQLSDDMIKFANQQWKSSISITRNGILDYFAKHTDSILDEFRVLTPSVFIKSRTNEEVNAVGSNFLMNFIKSATALEPPKKLKDPATAKSVHPFSQFDAKLRNANLRKLPTTMTPLPQAKNNFVSQQPLTYLVNNARKASQSLGTAFTLLSENRNVKVVRAIPSTSPTEAPPGVVIEMVLILSPHREEDKIQFFFKRFKEDDEEQLIVYILKPKMLESILSSLNRVRRIIFTLKSVTQTKTIEIVADEAIQWLKF